MLCGCLVSWWRGWTRRSERCCHPRCRAALTAVSLAIALAAAFLVCAQVLDHVTCVEYLTKYASKEETKSAPYSKLMAAVLSRNDEADDERPAKYLFGSLLIQQVWCLPASAAPQRAPPSMCSRAFFFRARSV